MATAYRLRGLPFRADLPVWPRANLPVCAIISLDMSTPFGTLAQLWHFPVKGMRGEAQPQLQVTANGTLHDRRFALRSSEAPRGARLLSGAERAAMLLYRAEVRAGETTVVTPRGERLEVCDPRLPVLLHERMPGAGSFELVVSARPLTDVRPISLLAVETVEAVRQAHGATVDPLRFRANLLLHAGRAFAEDSLCGRHIRIGDVVELRVLERTPRCRIVTLDPATATPDPSLMKLLDRRFEGRVGIYAAVVRPGLLCPGDPVTIV